MLLDGRLASCDFCDGTRSTGHEHGGALVGGKLACPMCALDLDVVDYRCPRELSYSEWLAQLKLWNEDAHESEPKRYYPPSSKGTRTAAARQDKSVLARLLEEHEGNLTACAQELAVTRVTVYARMRRFGLRRP